MCTFIKLVRLNYRGHDWIELSCFSAVETQERKKGPRSLKRKSPIKCFWMSRAAARTGSDTDAQSFSNSFEGVLGVVIKSREGGPLFSWLLHFYEQFFSKSFEGVHEVPLSSPLPPCASMGPDNICWRKKMRIFGVKRFFEFGF